MSWHRWLAMSALLLAVACSAAPSREVALHAGRREWIGPFGSGVLDLREDSSFCLSVRNEHSDACLEVSGKWRPLDVSCMWPADRSKQVTLLVRDSHASHPNADEAATWPVLASGTEIMVIVSDDSATYLGFDGVVDLNLVW